MTTIIFEKLTARYVRKLTSVTNIIAAFAILLFLCSLFWMLFRLGGDENNILFADVMYAVFSLFGACLAFRTVYLTRKGPIILVPRYQLAWFCVGLGLSFNSLGGSYYAYLEAIHSTPFPSYSDIGFTLLYPFALAGLLLMPATLRFRLRMGLDALITTLCFFGISWFFLIGPVYFSNVKQALAVAELVKLVVGLSYPCWDILLVLAIALFVQRRTDRTLYPSFLLLILGLVSWIWADTGYAYANIFTHTYESGTPWIDPFWFLGYVLMGLSGLCQYTSIVRKAYREQQGLILAATYAFSTRDETEVADGAWRQFQSLLLYIPLTVLLVLTLLGEIIYNSVQTRYLVVFTTFIGILVVIRYLRTTHENEKLLQERERERSDAEHLRQLNVMLTSILTIEPLLGNIVQLVTSELGFDAALLILREKQYDDSSNSQAYILVNTSSTMIPATNWRLQSSSFFSSLMTDPRDIEIDWGAYARDIPPEIVTWQKQQDIRRMHFFPLIYQNNTLGCLGVARKASSALKPHDISLLHKYIEQVVIIVKQAYLYRETYEQESFARAMVNIAARLNSALVAPAEIQQLLCVEGANALHADYTLLYVPEESGKLVPLAVYNVLTDTQQSYTEWPPILPDEVEAQAFYALQPMLISLQSPTPVQEHDKHRVNNVVSSLLREKLLSYQSNTIISAPLISGGESIGMLVLGRCAPHGPHDRQSFGREALLMAQDFAEQASVAFTNAYLYQHLRSAHDKMQALDQLKDQFMVTASHELCTPLTAVQGYIELLSQYETILTAEQRREFLLKARRSCEELVVMLGNVMDASRLEVEAGIRSLPLERVDVNEAVNSVITIIELQVQQEHRQIERDIPSDTFVLADSTRLRQVLMNISVNALKYSPPHTSIRFAATIDRSSMSSVILSISDEGQGIAPQDQTKLFQRFTRLERDVNSAVRGSGLGLYISRRLVEAMGGSIWIESSGIAGEGATFHVRLSVA